MLDAAVAAWLDALPDERVLDEPFMALLRASGYTDVHLVHGQAELGKDIIAKRGGEQWAFQTKLGNLGLGEWRDVKGQIDDLRESGLSHPSFDAALPRRPVLVLTGRFVGVAPVRAQEYQQHLQECGEPGFDTWDRSELIGRLAGQPDAVLRTSADSQLLGMLGAVQAGDVDMDRVEAFTRRWTTWPSNQIAGVGALETALVLERLEAINRPDLAVLLPLGLVRGAWANAEDSTSAGLAADAGRRLFCEAARRLWEHHRDEWLDPRHILGYGPGGGWTTYPLRCVRLGEILGLLALAESDEDIGEWLVHFVERQPGCSRPPSDRYAVCLIPLAVAIGRHDPTRADQLLRDAGRWFGDRYQKPELGLASSTASIQDEIERVLGSAYDFLRLNRRRSSQLAGVLLDLAGALGFDATYQDLLNDVVAVEATVLVMSTPDTVDQYLRDGLNNRWEMNPPYKESLDRDGPVAPHHAEDRELVSLDRWWDLLAISACCATAGSLRQSILPAMAGLATKAPSGAHAYG